MGFPHSSAGEESAFNAGDLASILGSERSPGEESGNTLQYMCLGNSHGQRTLVAIILGVARVRHNLATKLLPIKGKVGRGRRPSFSFLNRCQISIISSSFMSSRGVFLSLMVKPGLSSVQFSHSVVPDSLQHHESPHARPPCPSPTPGLS